MRKHYLMIPLAAFMALCACSKEDIAPRENFISATLGSQQIKIFENTSLNKDTVPNTFLFSFGQDITTKDGKKDTCIVLQASMNRQCFGIRFSKTKKTQTFEILRGSDESQLSSAFYMKVQKYAPSSGLEIFHTQNITNDASFNNQKVGEIIIKHIDWGNREIEGTFYFKAFGYLDSGEYITPTTNSMNVSNGEFYYHWTEKLEI